MRITLKLSQLKQILQTERLKLPIIFKFKNFTDIEFSEFQKLLQQSEERG